MQYSPHEYGLEKTQKQLKRQQAAKRKNERRLDTQAFLKRYFDALSPKLTKLIGDEYEVDEDYWIIREPLHGRKQYVYFVLTTEHHRKWRIAQSRSKKILYKPSTGGRQKYKTVPRKI